MAVMIDDSETLCKKCKIKIILDGEKEGEIHKFTDSGNIKLATQVSRSNFKNVKIKS